MKKKEFKTALIVALTASGIESAQEAILESACGKLGRKLRADTGEVTWADEHVPVAVDYYNEYGKPTEKKEKVEVEKTASSKKKKAAAKPMKNKTATKKAVSKKAVKKAAPKKAAKKK